MIQKSPSPNFSSTTQTKIGAQIHKTLGLMPGTLQWLQNPQSQASAHFLVTKAGVIHQLVDTKNRAWTAGRISNPSKRGLKIMQQVGLDVKPGEYLIQIEVECLEEETYTERQYESIVRLIETFDFKIESWNFLTHQDTAIDKPHLEPERLIILHTLQKRSITMLMIKMFTLKIKLLMKKLYG